MSEQPAITCLSVVVATKEQVSSELGEEAVILGLKKNTYFGLDGVGATVWALIREPVCVADVRDAIVREYDVAADEAERDLLTLLAELAGHGLVEIRDEPSA